MKNIFSAVMCVLIAFSSASFAADTPTKSTPTPASVAAKAAPASGQEAVNINTADVQALTKLKGVGTKKAEAIVAFRKVNGAFKSVDQLAEVKGIGAKTVEANRKNIRI